MNALRSECFCHSNIRMKDAGHVRIAANRKDIRRQRTICRFPEVFFPQDHRARPCIGNPLYLRQERCAPRCAIRVLDASSLCSKMAVRDAKELLEAMGSCHFRHRDNH